MRFHTASASPGDWNIEEIAEGVMAIAEVPASLREELGRIVSQDTSADEKREAIGRYLTDALTRLLEDRKRAIGEPEMINIAKVVMLQSIDMLWMDHLDQMEHLRDSVRLRAYGQRDPLVEYKNEGLQLFKELQAAIRSQVVNTIFKVAPVPQFAASAREPARTPAPARPNFLKENLGGLMLHLAKDEISQGAPAPAAVYNPTPKKQQVGRNDPCPCGSGKKYKKCHGKGS